MTFERPSRIPQVSGLAKYGISEKVEYVHEIIRFRDRAIMVAIGYGPPNLAFCLTDGI